MTQYEYKVVPAPTRGQKARGIKTPEARFAHALELGLNAQAEEGWEYVRAEVLPSEERQGLTGTATHYRNVLIFRREVVVEDATTTDEEPTALLEPPSEPEEAPAEMADVETEIEATDDAAHSTDAAPDPDAPDVNEPADETAEDNSDDPLNR